MDDEVEEIEEVVEPPEDPSRAHKSSCMTAAILALGSPLLFAILGQSAFSGGGGLFIAMCPILILMSLVGFVWGLVLAIMGDPADRAQEVTADIVGEVPPVGSYAERLPDTDDEGRML